MVASKAVRVLFGSFVFSSFALAAQAQTCEKNEDCPQGFSCHEDTATRDCAPVAPCDGAKDCAPPPPCGETVVTHACRPASCDTDADCGAGLICFAHTSSECSAGSTTAACAPNEKCASADPPPQADSCTEKTEKLCAPTYVLPCEEASDCGEGFSCEPDMECSCSGSSGSPPDQPQPSRDAGSGSPVDAGASNKAAFAPVPPPKPDAAAPACECHALEHKHCAAKIIKCQSNAECPGSAFTCVASSGGAVDCAASKDADAAVCGAAVARDQDKLCAPRYDWSSWTGGGRVATDLGGSASGPKAPSDDHDAAEQTSGSDKGDAGAAEPDAGEMAQADAAACSVTTPGARTGSAGIVLGFVMLALGMSKRKRSR